MTVNIYQFFLFIKKKNCNLNIIKMIKPLQYNKEVSSSIRNKFMKANVVYYI